MASVQTSRSLVAAKPKKLVQELASLPGNAYLLTHLDRVQLRARPDAMLVTIDVGYCGMQSGTWIRVKPLCVPESPPQTHS